MDLIIRENMERQIAEMWDAINDIPYLAPNRDEAISQANKVEQDLRERYSKQESLRDAAPELLEGLKFMIEQYGCRLSADKIVEFGKLISKAEDKEW